MKALRAPGVSREDLAGLTAADVQERVRLGKVNDVPQGPTRTVEDIVRSNVITRFNILLSAMLAVILFVAPIQDSLFGIVMVVNTAIGIVQEIRAKQTLDRLALLSAPKATVVREGSIQEIPIDTVVLDDVLELRPGDQVVVDGTVLAVRGLEVDESLLTGEADPVQKQPGDQVLSGSFGVAGIGRYRATRVGREAYAVRLAEEARRFTLVRSELRSGIDWILAAVSWALIPTVILLVWSQLDATNSVKEGLRSSVAGTVGMVPQGLVLLTSVAFAVGVIRLGRKQVLVQELPAVEGLARTDVVCFDKTGTLTKGHLSVQGVETLANVDPGPVLGAIAAADPSPNTTLQAIGEAFAAPEGWSAGDLVPFSSARKWSATSFDGMGTWFLGAPEVLVGDDQDLIRRAEAHATEGQRVLLLARTDSALRGEQLPEWLEPAALVVLGDEIRPDAADTLRYFAEQGVQAKVISGDHPRTVAAIAKRVGIPGADRVVDARRLPDDEAELIRTLEEGTVFGRVTPHQKRMMVKALQSAGHVVAMTGDGVNDVLALKDADIGIAMGSGSSASRAVAQIVLLDGAFDTLPSVVAEGRRVISNIERVANLFVTKTVYAFLLAFVVGAVGRPFPFLPRHLTLVGSVTIGIPAFFLALAPSARRARTGFIKRVLRFAIPTGALAAAATFGAYELAIAEEVTLVEARTTATVVLAAIGLLALAVVSRPLYRWRKVLIAAMGVIMLLILANPGWRTFFELDLPRPVVVFAMIGIVAITASVMALSLSAVGWLRQMREILPDLLSDGTDLPRWLERLRAQPDNLTGEVPPVRQRIRDATAEIPAVKRRREARELQE